MPVPAPVCVLAMFTAPVDVSVAPIVSVVPDKVMPTAVAACERLMVPDDVNDMAPLNVSDAVVVMLPAALIVKLLIFVIEPIANAVVPLFNVTLFVGPACPVTFNAPIAFVFGKYTVQVCPPVVLCMVTFNAAAVIAALFASCITCEPPASYAVESADSVTVCPLAFKLPRKFIATAVKGKVIRSRSAAGHIYITAGSER